MSREKQGYHDTIAQLNEMFPDKGMLTRADVAKFMGVSRATIYHRGIQFNKATGRIAKADLARLVCL